MARGGGRHDRSGSGSESEEERFAKRSQRPQRKVKEKKFFDESGEEDVDMGEEEEASNRPNGKAAARRSRTKRESEDADADFQHDADEEDDDWEPTAKKILKTLWESRDNDGIFNEPVNAKKLGLNDYHDIIKSPMDLGTVKKKLSASKYTTWKDFVGDVHLTFKNALQYNPEADGIHQLAKKLLKKFQKLWNDERGPCLSIQKGLPQIGGDLSQIGAGEDEEEEKEEKPKTSRSKGKERRRSTHTSARDGGSDSDQSGYAGQKEGYTLRENRPKTIPYALEQMKELSRKARHSQKATGLEAYVKDSLCQSKKSGRSSRSYNGRKSTVVTEGGKRFRVMETDASESGEDVPSKSFNAPPKVWRRRASDGL